jgi:hypothetical protein
MVKIFVKIIILSRNYKMYYCKQGDFCNLIRNYKQSVFTQQILDYDVSTLYMSK